MEPALRFRPRTRLAFLCCLLIVASPAVAQAPASAEETAAQRFAAGSRAFESGDFRQALADFEAAIAAGESGPAVHYNVAVCYYKLADYRRAESAFKDLAQRFPAMRDLAEYNVGLALTEQGRRIEARDAFERARAGSDAQVAALANVMLERLTAVRAVPPARVWTQLVDIRVGHDDNVALIDAASLPAGVTTDSSFAEVYAYFSGPAGGRPWRVDASTYLAAYPDASEFDQRVVYLGAAREWRAGGWSFDAGPGVSYATLDGDAFEQRVGVLFNMRRAGKVTFAAQLAHDDIDHGEARFSYVDGTLDQLLLVADRAFGIGRVIATYYLERNDRADPEVSADRDRYVLRFRRSFNATWAADFMYEYRKSDYTQLSPAREEERQQIGIDLGRNVSATWQVVMQYRFADSESNDAAYRYDRHRISVGVSTSF